MEPLSTLISQPIFFERNRVFRVYDGGKLLGSFTGEPCEDGKYPEEWIASTVRALNRDSSDPMEGLSLVEGTSTPFRELLEQYPQELLGTRSSFDVLVKFLDSAIRLPIQVHPDPTFSRKHFSSDFGKTEAWLILVTRENAKIYFGFRQQLTKEEFSQAVERSRVDKNALTPLLNEVAVHPGEVYLIPARCVHAIGYGCMILEVQEPTDFTIQPEYWCGDYQLSDYELYLGLEKEVALDCFDFGLFGPEAVRLAAKEPVLLEQSNGCCKESLIRYADTPCFAMERYTVTGSSLSLLHAPAIYVVTAGEGQLIGDVYRREIAQGSYFFLPHCAGQQFTVASQEALQLVCCLPPQK